MFVKLNMRSPYQIFDKLDDASESEKQEKMLSFTLTVVSLRSLACDAMSLVRAFR